MSNKDSKNYNDHTTEPTTATSTTEDTIVISPSNTEYKIHDQKSSIEQEEEENESLDIGAKRDSQAIQTLGANVEKAITVFEDTITNLRKESYDEQAQILTGYKKLIQEQINVINARLSMVKKFKQID